MKKLLSKKHIAFTLSEMMIVILIVSVISAATIPAITQQRQKKYNVSGGDATSTALWQKDAHGLGIYNNGNVGDSSYKVVAGSFYSNSTEIPSNDSLHNSFDNSNVSLLLANSSTSTITKISQNGQIVLYDSYGMLNGTVSLDANKNIYMGLFTAVKVEDFTANLGKNNVGIGFYAGSNTYSPAYSSILVGAYAGADSQDVTYSSIAIGAESAWNTYYNDENIYIGKLAGSPELRDTRYDFVGKNYVDASYAHNPASTDKLIYRNNIAIGSYAGLIAPKTVEPVSTSELYKDKKSLVLNNYIERNIAIGYSSGFLTYAEAETSSIPDSQNYARAVSRETVSIGAYSGFANFNANVINLGDHSGYLTSGTNTTRAENREVTRTSNVNIGYYAGGFRSTYFSTTKNVYNYNSPNGGNVSIGKYAGFSTYGADRYVAIGPYAGSIYPTGKAASITGTQTYAPFVAIGSYAMYNSYSMLFNQASNTTAIGYFAGFGSYGNKDVYIGRYAGYKSGIPKGALGSSNIFIGKQAGAFSQLTYSIAIGNYAGWGTKGYGNIFMGYGAGIFREGTITSRVAADNKTILMGYTPNNFISTVGVFDTREDNPQMIIGPSWGFDGGPGFDKTIMLLYANSVFMRSTTMSVRSDKRIKENIKKAKYGINELRKINVYNFNFKNEPKENVKIGLIAQEVQKVIPEAVVANVYDKMLNINFDWILYPLANSIKQVDATITLLSKDLVKQTKKILSLEKTVNNLDKKTMKMLEKQTEMQDKLETLENMVIMETK